MVRSIPHSNDTTSRDAAIAIKGDIPRLRAKVASTLARYSPKGDPNPHGLTDQQLQELTGLGPQTETPRRLELTRVGVVVDSGRVRKTRAGRNAIIWVIDWLRCTQYVLDTGDISQLSKVRFLFKGVP